MKLVFPMVLFALCLGLFSRRLSSVTWVVMGFFTLVMIIYVYVKGL